MTREEAIYMDPCRTAKDYKPLNLGQLQYLIERGRLDATKPISMYHIHKAGGFGTIKHGIKLLGNVSQYLGFRNI